MSGVGGAGGSSGGGGASSGAGSNSNSSGSAGKNDSNKNDKSSKSSGSDKSESKSSKGSDKGSFDRAMSDAQNKTDGGNNTQNKTEPDRTAEQATSNRSTPSPAHANELSGLSSLNSHRGYGPDEQPTTNPDQKAKGEAKTIDVQGKLDKLDRQLAQQKAHEERSLISSLVPDTNPDTCTPGHPTGQKPTPPASSVVYSGNPGIKPAMQTSPAQPPAEVPEKQYNFATPVAAGATIADGLITGSTEFANKMPANVAKNLTKLSKVSGPGGRAIGSVAETLEAVANAKPEDRTRAGITGFVASLDDFAVAAGSAKVGFAMGGPIGSAGLATAASLSYDNSRFDKTFDSTVYDVADKIEKDGLANTVGDGLTTTVASVDDAVVGTVGAATGLLSPFGPVGNAKAFVRDYNNSAIDKAFDKGVHGAADKISDGLEFVSDSAKEGIGYVADKVSQGLDYITDNIDQFEQGKRDQALNQAKRKAHRR